MPSFLKKCMGLPQHSMPIKIPCIVHCYKKKMHRLVAKNRPISGVNVFVYGERSVWDLQSCIHDNMPESSPLIIK